MPISQSRIIALINAALDSYNAVGTIQAHFSSRLNHIAEGTMTPEQAFFELSSMVSNNEFIFKRYNQTHNVIQSELNWYTTHAQSNLDKARMMRELRERRRANGLLPEPQRRRRPIPKSIGETDKLIDPSEREYAPKGPVYVPPTTEMTVEEWERLNKQAGVPTEPAHDLIVKPPEPVLDPEGDQVFDFTQSENEDDLPPPGSSTL